MRKTKDKDAVAAEAIKEITTRMGATGEVASRAVAVFPAVEEDQAVFPAVEEDQAVIQAAVPVFKAAVVATLAVGVVLPMAAVDRGKNVSQAYSNKSIPTMTARSMKMKLKL
jgi:hypothetical protein